MSEFTDADVPCLFVGALDDPDDLAYHFLKPDAHGVQRPYMMVLADAYQPLVSVERAFGHEADETLVDPSCERYDADGWAVEVADPVQDDDAPVDIGRGPPVAFSPIVLPAWCGMGGGALDSAGLLTVAHQVRSGGYAMKGDGSEVHAALYLHEPFKSSRHSRRMKRRSKIERLSYATLSS